MNVNIKTTDFEFVKFREFDSRRAIDIRNKIIFNGVSFDTYYRCVTNDKGYRKVFMLPKQNETSEILFKLNERIFHSGGKEDFTKKEFSDLINSSDAIRDKSDLTFLIHILMDNMPKFDEFMKLKASNEKSYACKGTGHIRTYAQWVSFFQDFEYFDSELFDKNDSFSLAKRKTDESIEYGFLIQIFNSEK